MTSERRNTFWELSVVQDFCSSQLAAVVSLGEYEEKNRRLERLPLLEADYHFCIGFSVENSLPLKRRSKIPSLLTASAAGAMCFMLSLGMVAHPGR